MKAILITGSSRGIGKAAAKAFQARGYRVILAARNIEATAMELGLESVQLDVTDDKSVARAKELIGDIDVLVNNAGITSQVPFLAQAPEEQRREMEVNYFGAQRMVRAFLPGMLARGSGTIVNVSSFLGEAPAPGSANYSATKAALGAWSHALRGEVARHGIKIVVFLPSHTATDDNTEFKGIYVLPVDYVAKKLVQAVEKTPRALVSSPIYGFFLWLFKVFPKWGEKQMLKTTEHSLERLPTHT